MVRRLGNEIDRLEIQVETQASKANQQLDRLVKNLNKVVDALGLANADGIGNLADGISKLSDSMKSMSGVKTSQFSTLAKNIQKITDVDEKKIYKTANALRNISNTVSGFNGSGVKVSINNSGINKQAEQIRTTTMETSKAMEDLAAKFTNVGKDLKFSGTTDQLEKEITKAEKYFDSLLAKEEKFNLTGGNKNTSTYANLQYEIAKTANWLDTLYDKEKQVSSVDPFANLTITHFEFPNQVFQGFEEFGKAIKKAKEEATILDETLDKSTNSFKEASQTAVNSGNEIKSSMQGIENQASALQNTMNLMKSSFGMLFGGFKKGFSSFKGLDTIKTETNPQAYIELSASIEKAEKQLEKLYTRQEKMQATGVKESSRSWKTLQYDIKIAEEQLERYEKSMSRLKASGKDVTFTPNKFGSLLKNIPSLKNGASSVIPKFKGLTSETKKLDLASSSLAKGLFKVGRMMKYTLLYMGIRSVINGTKEGFQNLAKYSSETNASLSMLMSSLTQLKNSFAAAFAPILTVVAPILNKLIQMLITAVNAIGQFFAALTGKEYYVRAKKVQQDYADSLEDTAKAAKDVTTSIDELNVVNDSASSGKKGNELSPGDMFETVEIDSKFKNLADTVKDIFGKIAEAAEPTRAALQKLWNEGFKELTNFSYKALLGFLDNFLIPVGLWMLSDNSGLPRFFNITNDLLKEINWDKLLSSLNDFWTALQQPTKFVWNSLMDFYEDFLKPLSVWTMGEGFPRFLDITTELINNINWDAINKALKNFWKALEPFAESVGEGLLDFYEDLSKVGADFINTVIPGGFQALADVLDNIDADDARDIGYGLGIIAASLIAINNPALAGIMALADIVAGIKDDMEYAEKYGEDAFMKSGRAEVEIVPDFIGESIIDKKVQEFRDKIKSAWNKSIEQDNQGIVQVDPKLETSNFYEDVKKWIKETNASKGRESIEVVPKFMKDNLLFEKLKEIRNKIKNWWNENVSSNDEELVQVVPELKTPKFLEDIENWYKEVKENFKTKGGGMIDSIKEGWNTNSQSFNNWLSEKRESISTNFGTFKENFKTKGKEIITGIQEGWNNLSTNFSTWLGQKRESVVTSFGSYWEKFVTKGKDIINGIKQGWNDLSSSFSKWLSDNREKVVTWFGSFKDKFIEKGKDIINGIKEGWESLSSNFKTTLSGYKDSVVSWFGDLKSKFVTKGADIISGIQKGWNDNWSSFKEWLSGLPAKIVSGIGSMYNKGKELMGDFVDGLKKVTFPKFKINVSYVDDGGIRAKLFKALGFDGYPSFDWSFYANGGMPNVGEAFIARENGPEMVGRIGNKSAVANNDQITTAITNAVVQGMQNVSGSGASDALLREQNELLRRILAKDTNVSLNGRKVNEELENVRRSNGFSFST